MLIKATIDRFENGRAVLRTTDRQSIIWPKDKLPANIHEGSVLRIAVSSDQAAESADKELAKDILNEILNTAPKD
jgi:hypothetical protein